MGVDRRNRRPSIRKVRLRDVSRRRHDDGEERHGLLRHPLARCAPTAGQSAVTHRRAAPTAAQRFACTVIPTELLVPVAPALSVATAFTE